MPCVTAGETAPIGPASARAAKLRWTELDARWERHMNIDELRERLEGWRRDDAEKH